MKIKKARQHGNIVHLNHDKWKSVPVEVDDGDFGEFDGLVLLEELDGKDYAMNTIAKKTKKKTKECPVLVASGNGNKRKADNSGDEMLEEVVKSSKNAKKRKCKAKKHLNVPQVCSPNVTNEG